MPEVTRKPRLPWVDALPGLFQTISPVEDLAHVCASESYRVDWRVQVGHDTTEARHDHSQVLNCLGVSAQLLNEICSEALPKLLAPAVAGSDSVDYRPGQVVDQTHTQRLPSARL